MAEGAPIVHLAFGEAGLPVPASVREALARAAGENAYGPVAGSAGALEAAAGYFERRRMPTEPAQIVFAPGSKALLFALLSVLSGDVVLPRPAWVSYATQAALAGKRVWRVPIPAEAGGVPDPAALQETLDEARRAGGDPSVLIITLPDNPTGTTAPEKLVREVMEIAGANGLSVVSDEIYRDLAHDPEGLRSPAEYLPERTYVTSGLSKSMALGGWRIGMARFPDAEVRHAVIALASEIWSSLAAPMQHVAAHVLAEPPDVVEHVARSRELHRAVTSGVHERLVAGGVECRPPSGGFYLYPDFEPFRDRLAELGADGGDALAELLLERFDVAVLSGSAFGDEPAALRFRLATSLLYGGTDEERREALASNDPTSLPRIRDALDRLGSAIASLTGA
jgi:aspartate aminotransferase